MFSCPFVTTSWQAAESQTPKLLSLQLPATTLRNQNMLQATSVKNGFFPSSYHKISHTRVCKKKKKKKQKKKKERQCTYNVILE
jgi:hypothetical protein